MASQAGRYDHPAYLSRDILSFGKSTAGANTVQYGGTAGGLVFPFDIIVRNMVGSVQVAGTSTSPGSALVLYCPGTSVQRPVTSIVTNYGTSAGSTSNAVTAVQTNTTTTTLGFLAVGTNTANSILQSGDMNVRIPAGQALYLKNGTDATGSVGSVSIEYYLDPSSAVWTGAS